MCLFVTDTMKSRRCMDKKHTELKSLSTFKTGFSRTLGSIRNTFFFMMLQQISYLLFSSISAAFRRDWRNGAGFQFSKRTNLCSENAPLCAESDSVSAVWDCSCVKSYVSFSYLQSRTRSVLQKRALLHTVCSSRLRNCAQKSVGGQFSNWPVLAELCSLGKSMIELSAHSRCLLT